ncbi:thioesterase-like superfamily-domain-containing protein [Aspergillus crustosus]
MPARAPSSPPTFTQAMNLTTLPSSTSTSERYTSTFPALSHDYAPNKPLSTSRSYGGHVFAQAIHAASLTLRDSGLRIHEANGYWTLAGYANRPFIYEVTTLSRTRSFALRQVIARQPTTPSEECPFPVSDAEKDLSPAAFVLTASFKTREWGPEYWLAFNKAKYGDLLNQDPASFPQHVYLRGADGVAQIKFADFPGVDVRTPDLGEYSSRNQGTGHRRLHIYRASEPELEPSNSDSDSDASQNADPNLTAAMHAYVSDRAGLSILLNAFGASQLGVSGSLNHKIVFHVSPEKMEMRIDGRGWYVQEMSTSRGGEGRGVIESRIWGAGGRLVATTIQDALFREVRARAKLV